MGVRRIWVVLALVLMPVASCQSRAGTPAARPAAAPPAPTVSPRVDGGSARQGCRAFEATDMSWVTATVGWLLEARSCQGGQQVQGRLFQTLDTGRRWRPRSLPGTRLSVSGDGKVAFTTGDVGYWYGSQTWVTADAGHRWRLLAGRSTAALVIDGTETFRVSYRGTGCPGPCRLRIDRAATGTGSWQTLAVPPQRGDGAGILADGRDILVTLPGNPAGGAYSAHTVYFLSSDDGASWRTLTDPCGGTAPHEWDTVATALNGLELVAACAQRAGTGTAVVVSHDLGVHFTQRLPVPVSWGAAVADSLGRLLIGTNAIVSSGTGTYQLAGSTDDGRHWTTLLTQRHQPVSDVDIDLSAALTCISTTCIYRGEPRELFTSTDRGQTWHRLAIPT